MKALAVLLTLLAVPAAAQDVPAWHSVTDVASDDWLNLRAAPGAGSAEVGRLSHDEGWVEVVEVAPDARGRPWGLVALPEGSGWALMRFLRRRDGQDDLYWLPAVACGGTEPFWTLPLDRGNEAALEVAGGAPETLALTSRTRSRNDPRAYGLTAEGAFGFAAGVLRRARCSDGMSDRAYGIAIDLMPATREGTDHLSGCCRLMR